jgi:hypothetical protein
MDCVRPLLTAIEDSSRLKSYVRFWSPYTAVGQPGADVDKQTSTTEMNRP